GRTLKNIARPPNARYRSMMTTRSTDRRDRVTCKSTESSAISSTISSISAVIFCASLANSPSNLSPISPALSVTDWNRRV
ncbi:hypothetical protein PFISCL1PPCAC_18364, partial [Pristionchus fissidentatus]